jgi:hypothetical protein
VAQRAVPADLVVQHLLRVREDLAVEHLLHRGRQQSQQKRRLDDAEEVDAGRLHRHHLVVVRQPAVDHA